MCGHSTVRAPPAGDSDNPHRDPVPSPCPAVPPARPWRCGKRFMVLITKKCLELRGRMEEPSSPCSADRGLVRGKSGLSRARKQLGIPGDMVVPRVLSPAPQGHQGRPPHPTTPSTRPGRAARAGAMSPWQEDVTVPSVARRLSPAPLHCLLPFIFPFNNKKEGGKEGRPDVHMTSQLLRKHVQDLFLEFIDFNKACSISSLL